MLKDLYTKYKVFVNGIIFSVMPFISFILMEFYEHNPFIEIRPVAFLFNILLRESFYFRTIFFRKIFIGGNDE